MQPCKTVKTLVAGLLCCGASSVYAGPILSAVDAVINVGGPGFGSITDTYNQSGLSAGYTSGVTDFDTYLATSPSHTHIFDGFEWFSENPTDSASVTYDLGALYSIDALALWNEESSGIGVLDLYTSTDGIIFTALSTGLLPTDNEVDDYTADVFSFASVAAQYIRFDMSACPQLPSSFDACAIGEVAFRSAAEDDNGDRVVSEPGTLALMALGLIGFASMRKRS